MLPLCRIEQKLDELSEDLAALAQKNEQNASSINSLFNVPSIFRAALGTIFAGVVIAGTFYILNALGIKVFNSLRSFV